MPRRNATQPKLWPKVLAWTLGSLVVLFIAATLIGQAWLNSYLKSPAFRQQLEEKASIKMRAKVEIAPVRFQGPQFFSDGFNATGTSEAGFSAVKVENIRGDISLPFILRVIFGERRFRIENVEVQRLSIECYKDRIDLSLPPYLEKERATDINNLTIRDVRVGWPGGGLTGTSVSAEKVEGGWKAEGHGGKLIQLGLPSLELDSARVVYKEPSLFVQEAKLRQDGGEITASGEIVTDKRADLLFKFSRINVTPLLPEDWRAKLHGNLAGELNFGMELGSSAAVPVVKGKVRLDNGVIETLPVLNKIADFLKTEQFRRLELSQASGDVRYDAQGWQVTNLVLEAKQLLAVRGSFTVRGKVIDGTFAIGVTPGPLQWLPGAQEKVFNTMKDGYAWTTLRITGTTDDWHEDLTMRLKIAAGEAVLDTATEVAGGALDTTKKGIDGAVDTIKKFAPSVPFVPNVLDLLK